MKQCQEKKSLFQPTEVFDWNGLMDENRILPDCKTSLHTYLKANGITCAGDLHYCDSSDLHEIAKCLKTIPRRSFCDSHGILFEA
jgi:hypothetical protein